MTESNSDVKNASQAVFHWLCYIQMVSRCNILAESSIKYPFVECLKRMGYEKIHLEARHPIFLSRYMDLFCGNVKDEDHIAILDEEAKIYVEFKYVRSGTRKKKEQQRIFDDILRLYQVKLNHPKTFCYFIITGDTVTFESCFRSIKEPAQTESTIKENPYSQSLDRPIAQGIYSNWFSFNMDVNKGYKEITLHGNTFFQEFLKNYEKCSLSDTNIVKTHLLSNCLEKDRDLYPQALALWEIL